MDETRFLILFGSEAGERLARIVIYRANPFASKVAGCAQAEEMSEPEIRSLVWLSLDCLIVNPPLLRLYESMGYREVERYTFFDKRLETF